MSTDPASTAPTNPTPAATTGTPGEAQAQVPPQPDLDDAEVDLSGSVILVVDDNAQNLELLQAYLETLPCTILTATDGLEAIERVEAGLAHDAAEGTLPDLILLDVMMPRMSGFEACRKLKDDPATRTIPIMMVTALNELGDIERGVEAGTDDFVTKPVNKLELLTRVKSLLRVRHLKRELDRTMAHLNQVKEQEGQAEQE